MKKVKSLKCEECKDKYFQEYDKYDYESIEKHGICVSCGKNKFK